MRVQGDFRADADASIQLVAKDRERSLPPTSLAARSLLIALLGAMSMSCAPRPPSDSTGPAAPTPAASTTEALPSAPASELVISVTDGSGAQLVWKLTCDPPGGDHPDPEAACRALDTHSAALRPVAKDRSCAQVYGGPEKATITGTWRGERVFSTLSRTNSCEIARWAALRGLLPPGGT